MNCKLSAYRILLVMAACGPLTWIRAAGGDERPNLEACGTATITYDGVPFEEPLLADLAGDSPEFGTFTGTFVSNLVGNAQAGIGVATLQFDSGTLVLEIPNELGADFEGHGGWRAIGGDGIFDGVTGGGTLEDFVIGQTDEGQPVLLFFLEGTLAKLEGACGG